MAEGYLSSQVIFPFTSSHFLYFLSHTIIPLYNGMLSPTFSKSRVSKIIARNHTNMAKISPKMILTINITFNDINN